MGQHLDLLFYLSAERLHEHGVYSELEMFGSSTNIEANIRSAVHETISTLPSRYELGQLVTELLVEDPEKMISPQQGSLESDLTNTVAQHTADALAQDLSLQKFLCAKAIKSSLQSY